MSRPRGPDCEVCVERGARPAPARRKARLAGETHYVRICASAVCRRWLDHYNDRIRRFAKLQGADAK